MPGPMSAPNGNSLLTLKSEARGPNVRTGKTEKKHHGTVVKVTPKNTRVRDTTNKYRKAAFDTEE